MQIERVGNGYRPVSTGEVKPSRVLDGAEKRAIDWATRNHTTSMVQTKHRSKQPSDGKVCGMRASRKTLCGQRSLNARARNGNGSRFVDETYGDDRKTGNDLKVARTLSKAFFNRLRVSGQ